jgi:hypothetical protein
MIVYTLVCSVLFAASLKPLISPGRSPCRLALRQSSSLLSHNGGYYRMNELWCFHFGKIHFLLLLVGLHSTPVPSPPNKTLRKNFYFPAYYLRDKGPYSLPQQELLLCCLKAQIFASSAANLLMIVRPPQRSQPYYWSS